MSEQARVRLNIADEEGRTIVGIDSPVTLGFSTKHDEWIATGFTSGATWVGRGRTRTGAILDWLAERLNTKPPPSPTEKEEG